MIMTKNQRFKMGTDIKKAFCLEGTGARYPCAKGSKGDQTIKRRKQLRCAAARCMASMMMTIKLLLLVLFSQGVLLLTCHPVKCLVLDLALKDLNLVVQYIYKQDWAIIQGYKHEEPTLSLMHVIQPM